MYKKTQLGWPVILTILPLAALLIIVALFAIPKDQQGPFLIPPAVLLIILMLFRDLTVTVDETQIELRYGVGLVKKKIALAEVSSCAPVKNKWWMGFGIRIGPGYILYNISGLDAVELSFKDGRRKVRVGTGEPGELCSAITSRLS